MLQTPKKSTKIVKSAFLSRESTTKQINFSPLSELDESFLINKNFGSPESNLSSPTLSKGLFAFSKNRIRKMSALKLALRNNDLNPESKDENLKSNYEDEQSMESEEDDEIYDEMEDKNVENGKNDFLMEKRHFVTAESPCHNILQDENCLDSGVNSVATRILGKHREKRIARKKVINAKDSNKRESITIPEDLTSHTNLIRDTDSKSISPPDSGLRRSKRLLLNAPIHAKAVLGTPQFNKLKQQRSIQKQINQYSSEGEDL
ncbi:hypothetical protein HK099_005588 [Clydaea vesicula]|uniref:Uncharacterized protein n=1 Tax=Clydaea vesicula TaxID=447962 RepID=A0AAD5TZ08_9FUNG|nr:hypothetical protein HK099_005588 [Clydaea vesicula]